ncbi:MAG: helix-turn-helix domain-containing protein [Lachnospiraceae bacterium]|nr:helix-turn-helix domain-containing protein [Lachnospiraceae bacterium]
MAKIETIRPEEAAEMLGVSPETVRAWLREGKLKVGIAEQKPGKEKYNYTIFKPHFERFMLGEPGYL